MFNTLAKWNHQCRAANKDLFDHNHTYLSVHVNGVVAALVTHNNADDVNFQRKGKWREHLIDAPSNDKIYGLSILYLLLAAHACDANASK